MQIDWDTTISYISNFFVAGAAVATAFIAWKGLNKWREEVRGKAEIDTSRQLYRAVLQLRNEIAYVRSSIHYLTQDDVTFMRDIGVDPDHYNSAVPLQRKNAKWAWYQSRWRGIQRAMKEVDAAELEAEVILGVESIREIENLRALTTELLNAITDHLDLIDESDPEIRKQTRVRVGSIIFSTKDDEFSLRINEVVESIRAKLKIHLGH